jgi:hypothetical protein
MDNKKGIRKSLPLAFGAALFWGLATTAVGAESATGGGSWQMGQKLFQGLIPFQKGGPSCMACHDIAGSPFPGGGTLGPDLTKSWEQFGEGMDSILSNLPYPSMLPLYGQHPLNLEERRHLEAFFRMAGDQSPRKRITRIGLLAVGGFLILVIITGAILRNRLLTVRKALLEKR